MSIRSGVITALPKPKKRSFAAVIETVKNVNTHKIKVLSTKELPKRLVNLSEDPGMYVLENR